MTDIPTTPEAAREQQARWQERLEAGTCDCPTLAHDHANLLGAYAEMLEREAWTRQSIQRLSEACDSENLQGAVEWLQEILEGPTPQSQTSVNVEVEH